MAIVCPYLSIISLNINGLDFPIKRHRMAKWVKIIKANNMPPTRDWLQP